MSVVAQSPLANGRLYITEAVILRTFSLGESASGLVRSPKEYCMLQYCAGFTVKRMLQESILPVSMSQRYSSGPRPWNPEASMRNFLYVKPAVTTSLEMWVESSKWC